MNWCRFVNRGRLVRFTSATILIDLLPGNSRLVLLKTLIGFGIPTQALIPLGLIFRPDFIKHDLTTISFAYIASVWLWLGPLLVWRYERVTLKNFFVGCRYVVADWCAFVRYHKRFRVSLVNNCFDVAVFSIWSLLVTAAFISSFDFMLGFGVMSSFDWWWILAVFGVISYGFISAFGFLGVFRTLFAISNLLPIPIKIDPYHPDGNGGLGFIGSFLTQYFGQF